MTEELLATHQILTLFEQSKSMADEILDNLSGLFANIDSSGKILRANKGVARLLGTPHEDSVNSEIIKIFDETAAAIFRNHLEAAAKSPVEFELPVQDEGNSRSYIWQIVPVPTRARSRRQKIFTCLGRDITDAKLAHSKVVTLAKDLELTKAMQVLLLPEKEEFSFDKIEVAAAYIAAETAGGDFWWLKEADKNKIWIIIADVTGHGAGSAMVTAMISGCIETLWSQKTSCDARQVLPDILTSINQRLFQLRNQPYWMTATAVEFDLNHQLLRYWVAAAPPILLKQKSGEVRSVAHASTQLGSREICEFKSGEIPLDDVERVLLLTDGVFECNSPARSEFGLRRVSKFLTRSQVGSPAHGREELLNQLDAWMAGTPPSDDTTFVMVDLKK